MSVTLTTLDGIKDFLALRFPDLVVEFFPENPATYGLRHAKGALLVGYRDSTFSPPRDVGVTNQDRHLTFHVVVMIRQLNGGDGAIAVLDRLRLALQGFVAPECRRGLTMKSERFHGQAGGVWQYLVEVGAFGYAIDDVTVFEDEAYT